jgi:hypothetical protein
VPSIVLESTRPLSAGWQDYPTGFNDGKQIAEFLDLNWCGLHQDMAMERPKYRDHRSVAIWVTWLHRHMVHQAEHRIDGR